MTVDRKWGACALVGVVLLAGCQGQSNAPPPKVKTGAEEAAREFFTALVDKDWAAAYQLLDAESKAGCSGEQFARLAQTYQQNLGFDPTDAVVQSCDERENEAVAHVNLKGVGGTSVKFYKDAVSLRHGASGWAVVLSPTFGKSKPAKG